MKRLFAIFALLLLVVSPAFALSDADYLKLKKNSSFNRADKKLTQVYNDLKKSMHPKHFEELRKNQREWIVSGRDAEARAYLKEGYSRVEAYTMATNDRARELPKIAEDIQNSTRKTQTKTKPAPVKKTPAPAPEPENYDDDDDDDNYGEIEEDRFKNSDGVEGNYSRNDDEHGGFMTILIIDKEEMEAEVNISLQNPEANWSATGWIDDNVMEVSDKQYSDCQAKFTFSKGKVVIETTEAYGWDDVLGVGNRLDGTYVKD